MNSPVVVQTGDNSAPTAPTVLTATAVSAGQIDLNWSNSTDNVGVAGYRVERCQGSGCSAYAQIGTAAGTAFSNTGLSPATSYSYRVRASDAAGNLGPYSPAAAATTQPAPPTSGTRAEYAFSEGSGTTTADASGNSNTGILANGPAWTAGKYGNALSFDGVNDYVSAADASALDLGATGTIAAWVRLDTLGRWHGVIAKGNANDDAVHNYALEITSGNAFRCILGNGGSYRRIDGTTPATTGQLTHLACTWDGSALRLYINGVLNTSTAQNFTPAPNTAPLFIGQFGGNADRLDGIIDEVVVYNRALSAAEIQTRMNTPIP
jgi:chitodextrinase